MQHIGNVSHSTLRSRNNVSNLLIVINAVNGAMDIGVTPAAPQKSHWTYFAICTTEVRAMVASIVFSLLFIVPGYQIYMNYLMNVNN